MPLGVSVISHLKLSVMSAFSCVLGRTTPRKSFVRSLWSGPKRNAYFLVWCGSLSHCNFSVREFVNNARLCIDRSIIGQDGRGGVMRGNA